MRNLARNFQGLDLRKIGKGQLGRRSPSYCFLAGRLKEDRVVWAVEI